MPIPKVYQKPGQNAIASYDYVDISNGTGVVIFYGYKTAISGTAALTGFRLGTETLYSAEIDSSLSAPTSTIDFDLTAFNKPVIIKGVATIRFSCGVVALGTIYFNVYIKKINLDASVTTLASATSPLASAEFKNFVMPITIPETHFKRGEALRVELVSDSTPAKANYLGHDPANRNGAYITDATLYPTKFEAHIPFKIDL